MLTEQRRRFVDEYLALHCRNKKEAAIRAGYSPKTAAQQGCDVLKDTETAAYFEQRKSELASDLRQEFIFEASEAFRVLVGILKDPEAKDSDRLSAAKDVLDRAGFKPQDKIELSGVAEEQSKLSELLEQRRKRRDKS